MIYSINLDADSLRHLHRTVFGAVQVKRRFFFFKSALTPALAGGARVCVQNKALALYR